MVLGVAGVLGGEELDGLLGVQLLLVAVSVDVLAAVEHALQQDAQIGSGGEQTGVTGDAAAAHAAVAVVDLTDQGVLSPAGEGSEGLGVLGAVVADIPVGLVDHAVLVGVAQRGGSAVLLGEAVLQGDVGGAGHAQGLVDVLLNELLHGNAGDLLSQEGQSHEGEVGVLGLAAVGAVAGDDLQTLDVLHLLLVGVAVQEGGLPLGQTGGVGQQLSDSDVLLAVAGELGPVLADLVVDIQLAAVNQQHDGLGGGHDLGDGGQVEHGVDLHLAGIGDLLVGGVPVVGALGGVIVVGVAVGLVQDDLAVLDGQDDGTQTLSAVGVTGAGLQLVVDVGPVGVDSGLDLVLQGGLSLVQEGDSLGAGDGLGGGEGVLAGAGGDALLQGPQGGIVVEGAFLNVDEGVVDGVRGLAGSCVQEADQLSAGAGGSGAELVLGNAVGDAVLQGPHGCIVPVVAFLHVHEGIDDLLGLGGAVGLPQEGDDVCADAQIGGAEGVVGSADGDAVLHGPHNGLVEEGGLGHVSEHALGLGHGNQGEDHAQCQGQCQDSLFHLFSSSCFGVIYL